MATRGWARSTEAAYGHCKGVKRAGSRVQPGGLVASGVRCSRCSRWVRVGRGFEGRLEWLEGVGRQDTVVPARYCDHRVRAIQGDVTRLAPADLLEICPPGFHTLLSDMAPNTAGAGRLDATRSLTLAHAALGLAVGDGSDGGGGGGGVLLPGGHFVVKLLEGAGTREWGKDCGAHFRKVLWVRPKSTRAESKEVYLVGLHRKL